MATYIDIANALNGQEFERLRKSASVAVLVKAHATIADNNAPAARKAWAKGALTGSMGEADKIINYLLGQYNALTVAQIAATADNTLLTAVGTAIDTLYPAEV